MTWAIVTASIVLLLVGRRRVSPHGWKRWHAEAIIRRLR